MPLDGALLELAEAGSAARRRTLTRRHPEIVSLQAIESLKRDVELRLRRSTADARRAVVAAEHLAREVGSSAAEGRALLARAFLLHGTARFAQARTLYERAAERLRSSEDREAADRVLLPLVDCAAQAGDDPGALRIAARARRVFARRGEGRWVAMVDMNLGNVHHRAGRIREALSAYDRAAATLESLGARAGIAVNDLNRANVLALVGRHDEARELFRSAAAFFRDRGQGIAAARAEYNAATLLFVTGEFSAALTALAAVETAFEAERDVRHLALVRLDRSEILLRLGQVEPAAEEARRAARAFRRRDLAAEAALAVGIAALARAETSGSAAARREVSRAADALRAAGWQAWAATLALHEAGLALRAGEPDRAAAIVRPALAALGRAGLPDRVALARLLRARADEMRGRDAAAATGYHRVLTDLAGLPLAWIRWRAEHGLARLARSVGDRRAAARRFRAAVRDVEAVRDALAGDEVRGGLLEEAAPLYQDHVLFLLEGRGTRRAEQAFELIERARARTLLTGLEGLPPAARLRDHPQGRRLLRELSALQRRVAAALHGDAGIDRRRAQPARLRAADLRRADRRARTLRIRLESLTGPGSLPDRPLAPAADQVRSKLLSGETLIAYAGLAGRLIAFVLDAGRLSGPHDLADLEEVERRIADLRQDLARPPGVSALERAASASTERRLRTLRTLLLDPLADRLQDGTLLVVPWGALHSVPFAALLGSNGPLAAERPVVRLPSAGSLWLVRTRPLRPGGRPLVLGVPDDRAPRVEEECQAVARLLPRAETVCGPAATRDRLVRDAPRARVLHIATHGLFAPESPRLSAFRLSDGWFGLSDVYGSPLRADIVFLASCDGGLGGVLRGGETLGLARGFLLAGARALVSSLGPVRDDAAAFFVEAFYESLRRGETAAGAHREALLRARDRFDHPALWALFVLDGDGAVRPRGVSP